MSSALRRNLLVILTLATALIHLVLLNLGMGTIDPLFTLNGLGFLALLYAYQNDFPKGRKSLVRWAFIAYALVTIAAYFAFNGTEGFSNPIGLLTKAIELGIVGLLLADSA